ncbi:MAG: beta-glucuronidase [Tenericutes bacterium]|nr:beta-glucuronidase [Mycoplasmatota bacterium]
MLYPTNNNKRISISLNGLWNFTFADDSYDPKTSIKEPILMGVPSSYNDLFTTIKEREHVGNVVYELKLQLPEIKTGEWRIRLGSATHKAKCYIDGELLSYHNGGFLPIDFAIPYKEKFRLTIVLDNRLDYQTLPIASLKEENGKEIVDTHFDFFNYAGLHRNVFLYHLPNNPIEDIVIKTKIEENALVSYKIDTLAEKVNVQVLDPNNKIVGKASGKIGTITIAKPLLWDIGKGNLYTLCVETGNDYYEETFGIREILVKDKDILLNGKKIYLKGFGMHEDHITIGRGTYSGLNIRDFNLLRWINANSFRTSHYPYDEEMYILADKLGLLIINEVPAVGMNFWSSTEVFSENIINETTKKNHMQQLTELVNRDKNHPSVIMYSVANEANTHERHALAYFKDIFSHTRSLTDLPIMIVEWVGAESNKVAQLADVIGLNRYIGWYVNLGDLETSKIKLKADLNAYYNKFKKPLVITEFGTDTIAGLHSLPSVSFSEEYQVDFIKMYKEVFDELDFVSGEHVWNFADFMTKQGITRINGNKKGVFTRDRQPKMIAHFLRENWK